MMRFMILCTIYVKYKGAKKTVKFIRDHKVKQNFYLQKFNYTLDNIFKHFNISVFILFLLSI